jgi:hypothetical protein
MAPRRSRKAEAKPLRSCTVSCAVKVTALPSMEASVLGKVH